MVTPENGIFFDLSRPQGIAHHMQEDESWRSWGTEKYFLPNNPLAQGMKCPRCGKMMAHIKGSEDFFCNRCRKIGHLD